MSTFCWSDFGCQILSPRRAFPFEQSCLEQYCLHDIEDRLRVLRGTTVPSAWKAAMLPDSPADASATLICGSPGCGKTMLGVEFLVNGARMYSEPGVFVAFEETQAELTENAASLKFDLDQLCREGLLAIDHVLIDRRCAALATSVHRLIGSDHRALYAELRLPALRSAVLY